MPPEYVFAGRSAASVRSNCSSSSCARSRDFDLAEVVEATDHVEVLEPGEVLVDRRVLTGQADAAPYVGGLGEHVDAGDGGRAGVGTEQRGEDPHGGRLAGPVGAEQGEHGAFGYVQGESGEGLDVAVRLREVDGDDCVVHDVRS